jgi:hypothetical protein
VSGEEPAPPQGTLTCPRCGNTVPPAQDWCLECGLPARTVVAPTPPWRVPIAVLAAVAALALAAMAVAFVDLTADPEPPGQAPAPAQAPSGPPADPTQATPEGAETVTTPGSTTPITEPGEVTVEREDEPPVTAPAPPADTQQQP